MLTSSVIRVSAIDISFHLNMWLCRLVQGRNRVIVQLSLLCQDYYYSKKVFTVLNNMRYGLMERETHNFFIQPKVGIFLLHCIPSQSQLIKQQVHFCQGLKKAAKLHCNTTLTECCAARQCWDVKTWEDSQFKYIT